MWPFLFAFVFLKFPLIESVSAKREVMINMSILYQSYEYRQAPPSDNERSWTVIEGNRAVWSYFIFVVSQAQHFF